MKIFVTIMSVIGIIGVLEIAFVILASRNMPKDDEYISPSEAREKQEQDD